METALDAIAKGDQEWQTYLLDWHRGYFAPAIASPNFSPYRPLPSIPQHRERCHWSERQPPGPSQPIGNRPKTNAPPVARR
ncbi:MAG: hypothetical protein WBG32_20740 [Nodosilinea sp.]